MRKAFFNFVIVSLLVIATGFVSSSIVSAGEGAGIKKIAIASFTVSDMAGTVRVGSVGAKSVPKLISGAINGMLNDAEKKLGHKWKVTATSSFIGSAGYRKQGVPKTLTVYVPKINGMDMPVFTQESKEIKSGTIDPQKAAALCKALNVDGIVLIFSEWSAKTGNFVPTTKAITKNVFTLYDRSGRQVFKKRVDTVGKNTIGASHIKAVNDKTIGEWRDSFKISMDKIVGSL